ncbi:putative permease [Halanaerobium saccharolyticum]|uniref:Putative permease n=1 Tax=Halanaerobium saccharolyticum TaxID=43595 RepID=A0A4R6LU26_9FIRM|nr:permease [Halanaerobium saccharolyticum]TDO92134.1 putative permease [Halanaerobium saccharolyticum]
MGAAKNIENTNGKENNQKIQAEKQQKKIKDNLKKIIKTLIFWGIILAVFKYFFPERFPDAVSISVRYLREMVMIFPAVLVIMGLSDRWVPTALVEKYLGYNSSFKGKFLAVFLGTLPTGPMYIAFPIAAELLRKNASLSNVIIFLGVWASLKIPQLGVEIQFIGLKFSILRFIFTLISIFLIGFIMEKIINLEKINKNFK